VLLRITFKLAWVVDSLPFLSVVGREALFLPELGCVLPYSTPYLPVPFYGVPGNCWRSLCKPVSFCIGIAEGVLMTAMSNNNAQQEDCLVVHWSGDLPDVLGYLDPASGEPYLPTLSSFGQVVVHPSLLL